MIEFVMAIGVFIGIWLGGYFTTMKLLEGYFLYLDVADREIYSLLLHIVNIMIAVTATLLFVEVY